jgi:hypothetical protein
MARLTVLVILVILAVLIPAGLLIYKLMGGREAFVHFQNASIEKITTTGNIANATLFYSYRSAGDRERPSCEHKAISAVGEFSDRTDPCELSFAQLKTKN